MIGIINCYYVFFCLSNALKKKRNKQLEPVGSGGPQVGEVARVGRVTRGKKRPNRKIDNVTKRIRN